MVVPTKFVSNMQECQSYKFSFFTDLMGVASVKPRGMMIMFLWTVMRQVGIAL